ncbi:MAG: NnrS family protein [Nitrospira sp. CG24D]|nr:MAG: NnrS family protein [Nitrospira sp. CG24D]
MPTEQPSYQGPALLSYGFRPFFLSAALFAGVAIPIWALILTGWTDSPFRYTPRDWHVHEMLFGFLPAVITGFLLTAMPNWTDRPPLRGTPLLALVTLWLAGRLTIAMPWPAPLVSALIDGGYLAVLAAIVWREIVAGKAWDRAPIGIVISIYATANILFHLLALSGSETDLPERMAVALMMLLLTLIGGRVTPSFTSDYLAERGLPDQLPSFSRYDGLTIVLTVVAALSWVVQPQASTTGWVLIIAGLANIVRLARWRGWLTWREPIVLILHVGYGWLAFSLLIIGGATLGFALKPADAVHALTTGAVGAMTMAVMTRASLGHTGRSKQADRLTIMIYILVNLGALLRVFGPTIGLPTQLMLSTAAAAWSGAYLLFAVTYGPSLTRPSLDE